MRTQVTWGDQVIQEIQGGPGDQWPGIGDSWNGAPSVGDSWGWVIVETEFSTGGAHGEPRLRLGVEPRPEVPAWVTGMTDCDG